MSYIAHSKQPSALPKHYTIGGGELSLPIPPPSLCFHLLRLAVAKSKLLRTPYSVNDLFGLSMVDFRDVFPDTTDRFSVHMWLLCFSVYA